MRWFRSIFKGIKNFIEWFPIIWRDRDFDHGYLEDIIKFKLKKMEKFFRSDNCWSVDHVKYADQIAKCLALFEKIENECYDEAFQEFYEKYPDYKYQQQWHLEPYKDGLSKIVFNETPEQKELYSKCLDKQRTLYLATRKELFTIFAENIDNWWD